MRLVLLIGAVLLAMLVILTVLAALGSPPGATGLPHPLIDAMRIGGDGAARLGGAGDLIALLQCLALLLIYLLVALGVRAERRRGPFWWLLGVGFALSLGIWLAMYLSYRAFLSSGETPLLLGFPLPTTLMLFGVFLGGSYLCWLYIWGFRRFIYTEEDEQAYEALRARAAEPRKPEHVGPAVR